MDCVDRMSRMITFRKLQILSANLKITFTDVRETPYLILKRSHYQVVGYFDD